MISAEAKVFLLRNSNALSKMILSGGKSFTIKKTAYDARIEKDLVELLLTLDGVDQAIPDETGITIVVGRRNV